MLRGIITRSGGEPINWSTQSAGPEYDGHDTSDDPAKAEMAARMGSDFAGVAGEQTPPTLPSVEGGSGVWKGNST